MNQAERDQLIAAALKVQQHAYCKYSDFPVGAAVLTASGHVYLGANVENASYGLTICAERAAASAAVTAGERDFAAIAVASRGGVSPCGACRQFLSEFSPDLPVIMVDSLDTENVRETKLGKLLPMRFEGPA
jgi:cytidine deaminase